MARRRRIRLPDDVRERLSLAGGDRVLSAAQLTDGWVVASRASLHVAGPEENALTRPWSDVDGARLDAQAAELSCTPPGT